LSQQPERALAQGCTHPARGTPPSAEDGPEPPGALRIDAISLDVDGTLYSLLHGRLRFALTHPLKARAALAMAKARETLRRRLTPLDDFWAEHDRLAAEALGWAPERLAIQRRRFVSEWLPGLARATGPAPGLLDFVTRARAARLPLAVVSDFPAAEKLEALGLLEYPWAAVIDASALGALKPLTAPFQEALDALGVPAERALHVGDRFDCDVVGARRAGMPAALRYDGRRPPALPWTPAGGVFHDFRELAERLGLPATNDRAGAPVGSGEQPPAPDSGTQEGV